ncbi:tetratricopeptide repeat protein [Kordia sp. YSTF-M3]|uniref:histidine kinase n=1 Tax=Kordia aestuariivivens TaxID=2759037 RepID=A0ABR7Q9M5_9FLAO|nr:ATP-binding protein [Kordia aestuariivivens]MBC8755227.1 tetratricopeptide repeat protein [Kordia aestuariivivens]
MFLNSSKWIYVYCCCFLISITVVFAQKQEYSEEFKKEILETCPQCAQDTSVFQKARKDKFHQSHYLFSKNEIDSSYTILTELLSNTHNKEVRKLYILNTIRGRVLLRKKLFDEAKQSFETAIKIGKQYQSPSINNQYALLGQIYFEQLKFSKAAEVFETWKASYVKNEHNNRINLHNLGLCYLHLEQYDKAQENLLESYRLNQKYKDTLGLARSSLDIANLYYQQYKDELAIDYFEKGLGYAKKAHDLEILQNALLNLAVVEENRKDFSKALKYRKEYEKIKDSIWNKDQIWKFAQNDKETARQLNEEQLKAEKKEKIFFIVIALLALILLSFLSYFYLKIRKQHTIIRELNTTKNKLFSILTHDLKTPIHTLKAKLYTILHQPGKNKLHEKQRTSISESYDLAKNTSLLIDNTLHWTLQSQNKLLFHQQKLNLSSIVAQVEYDYIPIIEENKLALHTDIDATIFVFADGNSLKIALRNVLDNAIKFSFTEGIINIKATTENNSCTLKIIDEGVGFDTNNFSRQNFSSTPDTKGSTSTGLGIQLSHELIEKNGGSFEISSVPNKGTTVSITLQTNKT